jgi:outer membrane lipoprotein
MVRLKTFWLLVLTTLTAVLVVSCAVISKPVRSESILPVQFKTLLSEADQHIGDTVILGGYILQTKNLAQESTILILQSPLGFGQEPKTKDQTQGRFIVTHKGFLEPEIYSKDRKITVAGIIVGSIKMKIDGFPYPHLKVRSREIFLWPEKQLPNYGNYYDPLNCLNVDCWPWHRHHPIFW